MDVIGHVVHGAALITYQQVPKHAKDAVVLIHGFNGSVKEFSDLPDRLQRAGIATFALDLRGHGASQGERGLTNLQRTREDLHALFDHIQAHFPKLRLHLLGHSLGGAYGLALAKEFGVATLIVAHVPRNLLEELGPIRRRAYHVLGTLNAKRVARGKPNLQVRNPFRAKDLLTDEDLIEDPQSMEHVEPTMNVGNYEFAKTLDAAQWAKRADLPVLVIQSDVDAATNPEHSWMVYDEIPGPVRYYAHEGGHSCFRDRGRAGIAQAIIDFVGDHKA